MALGIMIGSFTIGVALPSLVKVVVPSASWQLGVLAPACLTVGAAVLALKLQDGPHKAKPAPITFAAVCRVLRNPAWFYVTVAYIGHSFELFGGWAWIGVFLEAYFDEFDGIDKTAAPSVAFGVIAVGSVGCVAAGYLADRFSRTSMLLASNAISGACISALPLLKVHAPQWVMLMAAGLWGLSVNADSAIYSTLITESVSDPAIVGTAVTLSIACGFVMTAIAIYLVPVLVQQLGWDIAFPCLGLGPLVAIIAVLRLKRLMA